MRWTVGTLALLSVIGGFLQFAPFWHPLTTWLEPGRAAARRADATRRSGSPPGSRSLSAWRDLRSPGRSTRRSDQGAAAADGCFEKKFYWDELYDLVWYRSADLLARGLVRVRRAAADRRVDRRGQRRALGLGSRELGRAQNGLVRSYVLALAGGLAVLAVVFLAAR